MIQMMNKLCCNTDLTYIKIQNGGGFFSDGDLWYTVNGFRYHKYTGMMSLGMIRVLELPKNATNISLKIIVWLLGFSSFLYSGPVKTTSPTCFFLYGSIYNPSLAEVPCN